MLTVVPDFKYQVSGTANQILTLLPGVEAYGSILETSKRQTPYNLYRLLLTKSSHIQIRLTPCVGATEFFVFRSLADLKSDRNAILKSAELHMGSKKKEISNAKGLYFVKVQPMSFDKGVVPKFEFSLEAKVRHGVNDPAFQVFVAPNDGKIDLLEHKDNRFRVRWGEL